MDESNQAGKDEPRSTPLDRPFFLPVLLLGLGLWFAYDGWFNAEIKAVIFNRVGAAVLLAGAAISGASSWRNSRRAEREEGRPPCPD